MNSTSEKCFIYALLDPRNGAVRYIGQTRIGIQRPRTHSRPSSLARAKRTHTTNWIRKLVARGFSPLIWIIDICSLDQLNEKECYYIVYFRSLGCKLTNHSEGGSGLSGYKHSTETRLKLSQNHRGYKLSEEHKKKLSVVKKGNQGNLGQHGTLSEETKEKVRQRIFSEEHRRKLSIAASNRKKNAKPSA